MADSGTDRPELGLEARIIRLEAIVAALDREELDLEDALRLFEEGIGHVRAAEETLRAGELRIQRLLEDAAGGLTLETLEPPVE
jgi:exodeoxyribonuclease VII small subunit